MMTLTEKHERIMSAVSNLLVTGGPGSGKTTISVLKAADVAERQLGPGQRVLFLSFARATVSRVIEAIGQAHEIPRQLKSRIHVETYHAFFWRVLKTHGYLLGLPRRLSILLPQNEAIALSHIRSDYEAESRLDSARRTEKREREEAERRRLAAEDGRVCFDLFAPLAGDILHGSDRIRSLIALMFPYLVLDEFQDTNGDQWHVVKALASNSVMCALADPDQRIYDWIGADPERLEHFREHCEPEEVDLGSDNHRNEGTEIRMFGDDVLRGRFRKTTYNGITFELYPCNQNQAMTTVVTSTLQARKRLLDAGHDGWSLAILTPTRLLTRLVSDVLRSPPGNLPEIPHVAAIELEGAILSAELLAHLLEPDRDGDHLPRLVEMLCNYYRGKGGDAPAATALKEAERIRAAYEDFVTRSSKGQEIRGNSLLVATFRVYSAVRDLPLSGNPDTDWLAVRASLESGVCKRLKSVASELRNVRLLDRGTQLRQALAQDWRDNGTYANAVAVIRQTFVQQHFAMTHRPEAGVTVMNMHKAKGKQFDEVILFDGWPRVQGDKILANPNRIVRGNDRSNDTEQARRNLRVSVTRGRQMVTILTPDRDPCILFAQN